MEKQTIIYEIPEKLFSEDVFTFAAFVIGAGLAIASVLFELKKTRRLKWTNALLLIGAMLIGIVGAMGLKDTAIYGANELSPYSKAYYEGQYETLVGIPKEVETGGDWTSFYLGDSTYYFRGGDMIPKRKKIKIYYVIDENGDNIIVRMDLI